MTKSFGGRGQGGCGRHFARKSGKFIFPSRRREGPRSTTSHRSPFCETADRPATARGDSEKHREGGILLPPSRPAGGIPKTTTTVRVAAREEAAIGRHQRGTTSTEQNKQFDPGGCKDSLFLSAKWLLYMLYALLYIFLFCLSANFFCYHARFKKTTRILR